MEYDVTVNRQSYLGGSDIPIIMGISSFKTRYELMLEKAGLKENEFKGNRYTEYGHIIEPKIREHINNLYDTNFEPNRVIKDDLRCHSDGFNGEAILEIKSTSHIFENVDDYRVYLVQLLLYMQMNEVDIGILAVYERPEDFNEEFDENRLMVFQISMKDYTDLLNEVNFEIDRFRADLSRLKENPLLSEEDFQPNELITLSKEVLVFEKQLAEFKLLEQEYKEMKQQLYEAMEKHNVKSWNTVNGVKITRVDATKPITKIEKEFDVDMFKAEHPDIYEKFVVEKEKRTNGKSGYVKITLPK
jgi:predicted phage-related endonuclease